MKTISRIFFLLLIAAALSACSFNQTPKREVYAGKDQVGEISKEMIIGKWEVTILNPIEGEQAQKMKPVAHYSDDGSLTMDATFDSGMGDVELEVIGTWLVEGDSIKQIAEDVREKSGSGMGVFIDLFKGMMLKNSNATFNVYEAGADRLLLVSDEGQAQELIRLK